LLPPDLAHDPKASEAFREMYEYAETFVNSHGKPPKRTDAALQVGPYPVYKAMKLYRHLPQNLRNPSRTRTPQGRKSA
jgi:hypothetical protein